MPVAALTGMIPIAIGAGMVLKFTEAAMPRPGQARRRTKKRRARRPSPPGIGNFSNLGLGF